MALIKTQLGWIEVICGSMFSGKSEELIRRLRRAMIAKRRVPIFKFEGLDSLKRFLEASSKKAP